MQTTDVSRSKAWMRVITLALAGFIFNTTEFVPVGLLSDIAASFSMHTAQVGLILTIYAWCVALTSLPLMLLTRNVERRTLLALIFVVFIASHILCGMAWNFHLLVIGRLGIALSHAIFWSITASLAIRVAPQGKKAQALSMLATGTALAMVLGLPLGRAIGQYVGWRVTFYLIGVIAVLTLICLIKLLPRLPSQHSGSLSSVPLLFRRPALASLYALVVMVVTAHYTAYSYIEPFVLKVAHMSANFATLLLLVFGAAGIIGSLIFSRYSAKYPSAFLISAIFIMTLCLVVLLPLATRPSILLGMCVIWGIAIIAIGLSMQVKVLTLAPDATDVAMSLFSGIFNIGIGAGALLGNQIILHLDLSDIGYSGALMGALALAWCIYIYRRYPLQLGQDGQ